MIEIITVRLRNEQQNRIYNPAGHQVREGDTVVVETAQGMDVAVCTRANEEVDETTLVNPLRPIVRVANAEDLQMAQRLEEQEKTAFRICKQKIANHHLDMKLVSVNCCFNNSKITFYFTAEERVDFRQLVRDLAATFHTRIELRQIGVRDETSHLGGLGICGQPFCCARFLDGFAPVSVKMAKVQGLSLNPAKISGACGRLMCCLKYEQDAYEDAAERLPKVESFVQTPDGTGNVKSVNLLRETMKVALDDNPSQPPKCYHNCEVCVLRNGRGSREGIEIPEERPERFVEERPVEQETVPFYMGSRDIKNVPAPEKPAKHRFSSKKKGQGKPKPLDTRNVSKHRRSSHRSGRRRGNGSSTVSQ